MDPEIVENAEPVEAPAPVSEPAEQVEGEPKQEAAQDKPLTEEQIRIRELEKQLKRERNRIGKVVSQRERFRLELEQTRSPSQQRAIDATNQAGEADSEMLTLSHAELDRLIAERAPEVSRQRAHQEKLRQAATVAAKTIGEERFIEMTNDLASVLDGKKQLVVLRADKPADVLEYLTDPDNLDEADELAQMDDFDFGRALTRIEAKLEAAKKAKPQRSNAPAPIEPLKGQGALTKSLAELSDAEFNKRRREQIAKRR